jgi:predicted DNA-binding transcriptional regulator AlpA
MPATAISSELLIADEVCKFLRIHKNSLKRWINEDWFPPPIRLGPSGRWLRWRRAAVEKFLRELEEGDHAPAS